MYIQVEFIDKEVLIYDFINFCFDENDARPFKKCNFDLPFVKKWKTAAYHVIAQMNEALRMKKDASIRHRQHIHTFTSDIITVSSIKSKMVMLIEEMQWNVVPLIAKTTFWATRDQNSFRLKFCSARKRQERDVTIITATKQGVPVRIDAKAKSCMDLETKLRVSSNIYIRIGILYIQN